MHLLLAIFMLAFALTIGALLGEYALVHLRLNQVRVGASLMLILVGILASFFAEDETDEDDTLQEDRR